MTIHSNHKDLQYRIALTLVPGIGPKTAMALLGHFGTAEDVLKATFRQLIRVEGMGELRARMIRNADVLAGAEHELKFAERYGIHCLFLTDEAYPFRLTHCPDAPLMLYYKGSADLNAAKTVSVVGTRKNSSYGQGLCEELVEGLAAYKDLLVVSGLAYGIDAIAHRACLRSRVPTLGVLAHGLDRIYPATHRSLAKEMQDCGGLLTEFPSGTSPDKANFPVRNRIVAGMSDVTVVVESGIKGGAVITAYLAAGYNREVAAFPGRVQDAGSMGCHRLIRSNIAALVTGAEDLAAMMGWEQAQAGVKRQESLSDLPPGEQAVISALKGKEQVHADELLYSTGLSNTALAAALLSLEIKGMIRALPGKYYRAG